MKESSTILTPHAEGRKSSLARDIIEQIAATDLPFFNMPYPVTKDEAALTLFWTKRRTTVRSC